MTDEQRTSDLVELHALCARYMSYTSQFLQDRWLDVFTPDAEYNAFGTPYTLERFPALLEAAPRGQFIGNMPVVELDGDTAPRRAALRVHRSADARDAARLVPRRVRAHARRVAHPPARHDVHAQERRLRLRPPARPARRHDGPMRRRRERVSEDHQRRRPRRRARPPLAGPPPGAHARAQGRASSGRAGATSRSRPARRTSRR